MSIINRLSTVQLNVSWLVIYRWLPKFIGTHPSRCRKSNSKWGGIIIGIQVWKIFGLNDDNEKWVLRMPLDLKNAMCFQTCKGPRRSLNPMIGYMFLRTLMNSSVGTVSMSHIMWRLQLVLNSICLVLVIMERLHSFSINILKWVNCTWNIWRVTVLFYVNNELCQYCTSHPWVGPIMTHLPCPIPNENDFFK